MRSKPLVSIVAPVYNEEEGIKWFDASLRKVLSSLQDFAFEIIYINDGSSDDTLSMLYDLKQDTGISVQIIDFSRNFGKEPALSAGIHQARGDAVLMLDSDGQHPVELIPEFLDNWKKGSEVVVGVRKSNQSEGMVKRFGSILFYKMFNSLTGESIVPGSTDFRLIDRVVADEFIALTEKNRITRGLIDWLGFHRSYIPFAANERKYGTAGYTFKKLVELAVNTFVSLSTVPLFLAGYVGLAFLVFGFLAGLYVLIFQLILGDPFSLNVTGSAMLGLMTIFLVGIILAAQGLLGVYISRLSSESKGRPLYIIRRSRSKGSHSDIDKA